MLRRHGPAAQSADDIDERRGDLTAQEAGQQRGQMRNGPDYYSGVAASTGAMAPSDDPASAHRQDQIQERQVRMNGHLHQRYPHQLQDDQLQQQQQQNETQINGRSAHIPSPPPLANNFSFDTNNNGDAFNVEQRQQSQMIAGAPAPILEEFVAVFGSLLNEDDEEVCVPM